MTTKPGSYHACLKYSGRVGRSAAAKDLGVEAVRLAVAAHLRHRETKYDSLMAEGMERWEAREEVGVNVHEIMIRWSEISADQLGPDHDIL